MTDEVPTVLNWFVSKNGREWFYVGTTSHAVVVLIVKQSISAENPYLKVEEVMPGDGIFKFVRVVRNTFEEAQGKQQQEAAQEEIIMLDKMYYKGNDQTH